LTIKARALQAYKSMCNRGVSRLVKALGRHFSTLVRPHKASAVQKHMAIAVGNSVASTVADIAHVVGGVRCGFELVA
jgi:hypothetical protein